MKSVFIILSFLLLLSCASRQVSGQTNTSKKAREAYVSGQQWQAQGNHEAAKTAYMKAIEIQSDYVDPWYGLATVYQQEEAYSLAIEAYNNILKINNKETNPYIYYNSALCAFYTMQYDIARNSIEQFTSHPELSEADYLDARRLLQHIDFAENAYKNPVEYNPINAGNHINTQANEYYPSLTADGQQLFFTRQEIPFVSQEDIFHATIDGDSQWTTTPISFNSHSDEGAPFIASDGKYLLFAKEDVYDKSRIGNKDIYLSKRTGEEWSAPRNLGAAINSRYWDSQPYFSADGQSIYFSSKRPGGYGGADLYVSHIKEGSFTEPQNLGRQINTEKDEQSPFIHPDGNTLYFVSNGHPGMGKNDIFVSRLQEEQWGEAVNIGYPINTPSDENSIHVSVDGHTAYIASDRSGGYGAWDIYAFDLYSHIKPLPVVYVKGKVIDKESKKPLQANIKLFNLEKNEVYKTTTSDQHTGEFLFSLPDNNAYSYTVLMNEYLPFSETFSLNGSTTENAIHLEVALQPIRIDESFILKNILYKTGDYQIDSSSFYELNQLVEVLNTHPSIHIEIEGHTDNVGSEADNLELSVQRAKSVYDYLIQQNISPLRLTYKGFGEQKPIAPNTSEENRNKNRRTAFRIVDY